MLGQCPGPWGRNRDRQGGCHQGGQGTCCRGTSGGGWRRQPAAEAIRVRRGRGAGAVPGVTGCACVCVCKGSCCNESGCCCASITGATAVAATKSQMLTLLQGGLRRHAQLSGMPTRFKQYQPSYACVCLCLCMGHAPCCHQLTHSKKQLFTCTHALSSSLQPTYASKKYMHS